jgi:hypothetical protein
MGLATSLNIRPLGLAIMPDQRNMGQANMSNLKYLGLTIYLTQGKHRSENGVRPKTFFLELIFQQPQNLNNSFLKNNNSLIP